MSRISESCVLDNASPEYLRRRRHRQFREQHPELVFKYQRTCAVHSACVRLGIGSPIRCRTTFWTNTVSKICCSSECALDWPSYRRRLGGRPLDKGDVL
jgi:hypothetical protein